MVCQSLFYGYLLFRGNGLIVWFHSDGIRNNRLSGLTSSNILTILLFNQFRLKFFAWIHVIILCYVWMQRLTKTMRLYFSTLLMKRMKHVLPWLGEFQ